MEPSSPPTVLILTSEGDETASLVEKELGRIGASYVRLNTEIFGTSAHIDYRIGSGAPQVRVVVDEVVVDGKDIASIWVRRPEAPVPDSSVTDPGARAFAASELKAQLYGTLYSLDCPWVSHPESIRTASYKLYQLKVARACGFCIPETLVSARPDEVRDFYTALRDRGQRCAAKLVSKGPPRAPNPEEQYCIYTALLEDKDVGRDDPLAVCPATYQAYLEKQCELRVTVVGQETFACEIHSQATPQTSVDWRRYDFPNTPHVAQDLQPELAEKCVALTKRLGLAFSTVDLVVSPDGAVTFLELNPNGQWGWIEELTGLEISKAIAHLLSRGPV